MNLSTLIDVLIGMSLFFALLALCSSASVELWAALADRRANNLQAQLKNMLGDPLLKELMAHPLIGGLKEAGTHPSYIESALFRQALLDLIRPHLGTLPALPGVQDWVKSLDAALASEDNTKPQDVLKSLRSLLQHREGDMVAVNSAIDDWFNQCMQRATAWYKRNSQLGLFIASAVVVGALNADALQNMNALANNPALRAALVNQATQMVQDNPARHNAAQPKPGSSTAAEAANVRNEWEASKDLLAQTQRTLSDYGFSVGWAQQRWAACGDKPAATCKPTPEEWVLKLFGLLISILAASLGADFWFAMITRLLPLRSVGKSPDDKR